MMKASKRVFLAVCMITGCAGTQRLPPGQVVEFGGQRAQYHDVSSPQVNICRTDPGSLDREFNEMNRLLSNFLDSTPSKPDLNVTPAQIGMLQSSSALLPAVRAYELELQKAAQCKFDRKYDFRDLIRRGTQIVEQSQKRIEFAPTLANYLSTQKALGDWQRSRDGDIAAGKSRHCQDRSNNSKPIVYYASEDEAGNQQWLFCDGSKVSAAAKETPQYSPGSRRTTLPARAYLDIAARYPSTEVRRAPHLPNLPPQR